MIAVSLSAAGLFRSVGVPGARRDPRAGRVSSITMADTFVPRPETDSSASHLDLRGAGSLDPRDAAAASLTPTGPQQVLWWMVGIVYCGG